MFNKILVLANGTDLGQPALRRALAGVEVVFHQAALRSVPRSVEDPWA